MQIKVAVIVIDELREIVSSETRASRVVTIVKLDQAAAAEKVGLVEESRSGGRGENLFNGGDPGTLARTRVDLELPARDAQRQIPKGFDSRSKVIGSILEPEIGSATFPGVRPRPEVVNLWIVAVR